MKKLYIIKEKSGKWNFCLVVNGRKILNSANQGYNRRRDAVKVAYNYLNPDWSNSITRSDFNKLFRK